MSFKEIKDERLELQKYKAGYKAFKVLMPLGILISFAIFGVLDIDTAHPILYLTFLPFFVGMGIFSYYAREYEKIDEEQTALKIVAEQRTWKVIVRRVVFMAVWMGVIHYFILSRGRSIWWSVAAGLFFGISMGILEYYQIKSNFKKAREESDV
jgi:uncharacterized membrane protein